MSHDLPDRPSLEHLKHQARALLRTLRQRDPTATLAGAQHALARQYGFVSWRRLKAHVEALATVVAADAAAAAPASLGFARYTETLRRVTFFSRYEAAAFGSRTIESEHSLLGIVRDGASIGARLLADAGMSPAAVRAAVQRHVTAVDVDLSTAHVPFGGGMREVLRRAMDEADRLKQDSITTGHLLIGLLADKALVSAIVLREAGLRPQTVRDALSGLPPEP